MSPPIPTVSMGMPVRNGRPFLREAIDSLINQTYPDWELIISDNASNDGTTEICAEYARRDARIRLLRNEANVGAAENYNRVCREARGRYFKWAAGDDICLPTYLERCVEVLQRDPEVALCYPKTLFIDEHGARIAEYEDNMHVDHPSAARRFGHVICNFRRGNCVFGVIRTDAIRRTHLIGAYPTSDAVFAAEIAMHGRLHEVPEPLFLRRLHQGQSGEVHKTLPDVATWYRPHNAGGRLFPRLRFLGEHLRAVHHSQLPLGTRIACSWRLLHLVRRFRRIYVQELGQGCCALARRSFDGLPTGNRKGYSAKA